MQRSSLILMLTGSLLLFSVRLNGQSQDDDGTKGTKITFHVTSVRQEDAPDDCPTDGCHATRFTVAGYADVRHDSHPTEYVLTCTELMLMEPKPHIAYTCARVHAHNDYDATLWADSLYFEGWKGTKTLATPTEALYRIMSEKETSKQGK